MIDVMYRLPGYNDWILEPSYEFYTDKLFTCIWEKSITQQQNIKQELSQKIETLTRKRRRCCKYLEKDLPKNYTIHVTHKEEGTISSPLETFPPHINYRIPSLTHLCLSILVSLSDLSWVKYNTNFPDTCYRLCDTAKQEMIKLQLC